MTRTSSAAIDINPRQKLQDAWACGSSDGVDMSFVGSPSQFPASFVDVPSDLPTHVSGIDGNAMPNGNPAVHKTPETQQTPTNASSLTTPMTLVATPARRIDFERVPLLPGETATPVVASSSATATATTSAATTAATTLATASSTFAAAATAAAASMTSRATTSADGDATVDDVSDPTCTVDNGIIMLTNYRLIYLSSPPQSIAMFPLASLDQIDFRDTNALLLTMKEGRVQRLNFLREEDAVAWHRALTKIVARLNKPVQVETSEFNAFAWQFAEAVNVTKRESALPWLLPESKLLSEAAIVDREFRRLVSNLGLKDDVDSPFRVTDINRNFAVCKCYPEQLIVPSAVTDEDLRLSATYRALGRFPAVSWACKKTRSVLLRASQPLVGIFAWRSPPDERIFEVVQQYTNAKIAEGDEQRRLVILDARAYSAALANRAKGGGYESSEYYQQARVEFLGLPNIHKVRDSFVAMRTLLAGSTANEALLQSLQTTNWLTNLSSLLASSNACADWLQQGNSVLVHCSDGWDRTAQIVSLAKVMVDEYYRTIEGFQELIRREWVAFGHKFFDRQLSTGWDAHERSPIFLQFLEAVRHLQREAPTWFQFTHAYLIKLAQHAYSGMFGTFLFNSPLQRQTYTEAAKQVPVEIWRYLNAHNEEFVNQTFDEESTGRLKTVNFSVINLRVWHAVYADEERYLNLYATSTTPTSAPTSPTSQNQSQTTPVAAAAGVAATTTATMMATSTGSGSGQQMLKSKSSESINSISNTDGAGAMNNAHSGSNGTIASLEAVTNGQEATTTPSGVTPPSAMMMTPLSSHLAQMTVHQGARSPQETIDVDGLLRFHDEEQFIQRRNNARHRKQITERDDIIVDLKSRQRSVSERFNAGSPHGVSMFAFSNGPHGNGARMHSLGEADSDAESLGAPSDMSVVDATEFGLRGPSNGWELADRCHQCSRTFNYMSFFPNDRAHHCRHCLRVVCNNCSQNEYQVVEGDRSVKKRMCDACYEETSGLSRHEPPIDELPYGQSNRSSTSSISLLGHVPTSSASQPIPSPCKSQPRHLSGGDASSSADSGGKSPSSFAMLPSTQAVKG